MTPHEKLAHLADLLEAQLPADFEWDFCILYEDKLISGKKGAKDCGSAGCALGLAIHTKLIPCYDNYLISLLEAQKEFNITRVDALYFFDPLSYTYDDDEGEERLAKVTPQMVAAHIREFLA